MLFKQIFNFYIFYTCTIHKKLPFLCVFFLISLPIHHLSAQYQHQQTLRLMGSRFEIVSVHDDIEVAKMSVHLAIEEIRRIEALISSWEVQSQTSLINQYAGEFPIKVEQELFQLIERCQKISRLTDGAFDISFSSIYPIWKFDGSMTELPDSQIVKSSIRLINYKNIVLNERDTTVFLKHKKMQIGFGAIGKGYAAMMAKRVMEKNGIKNGLVNAGGDLLAWGSKPDGSPWQVGIADPNDKNRALAWLDIRDNAVVTSGDYEKYFELNGVRYSHIINPKTGYPVQGIKSVTVVCPDAEFADALATAVFVLGVEYGLYLVNQLKGVDCLIIDGNNQLHISNSMAINFEKSETKR